MATASDTPADTTMMRIVHDALRRDLARANEVLTEPGSASARPAPRHRRAPHLDDALPPRPPCVRGRRALPARAGTWWRGRRCTSGARPDEPRPRCGLDGDRTGGGGRGRSRRRRFRRCRAADHRRARRARRRAPPAPARGGGRRHAPRVEADHRGGVAGDREGAQPRPEVDVRARVRGPLAHRQQQRRRPCHGSWSRPAAPAVPPAARLRPALPAARGGVLGPRREATAARAAGEPRCGHGGRRHRRGVGGRP